MAASAVFSVIFVASIYGLTGIATVRKWVRFSIRLVRSSSNKKLRTGFQNALIVQKKRISTFEIMLLSGGQRGPLHITFLKCSFCIYTYNFVFNQRQYSSCFQNVLSESYSSVLISALKCA